MLKLGDAIAQCVLDTFKRLPAKAKPRTYPDGASEWVPLSGIVLARKNAGRSLDVTDTDATAVPDLTCVSLGCDHAQIFSVVLIMLTTFSTGMRCLPASKVSMAEGRTLHDWHAEIVALRAFNYYLLKECSALASSSPVTSLFIRRRTSEEFSRASFQPFAIKDDVRIFMYCSEAPCGDASMELIMAAQDDATPWTKPIQAPDSAMTGRGYFSELGVVRRKPARGDAPETMSKSCTDKLALRQCTSTLSSIMSLLIHPGNAYIEAIVLPESQHVPAATARAFSAYGRMAALSRPDGGATWYGGYSYRPFKVVETSKEFMFSRRAFSESTKTTGSNITAMWTPYSQEVLIGGSIQGNKQFSIRGSSAISKLGMWKAALSLARNLQLEEVEAVLGSGTYAKVKSCVLLEHRQQVKQAVRQDALQNWVCNNGGDGFTLKEVS